MAAKIIPKGNPGGGENWADDEPDREYIALYTRGKTYSCTIKADPEGDEFGDGATCSFGDQVAVSDVKLDPADKRLMTVKVKASLDAKVGDKVGSISVTNPDGSTAKLANCFSIQ